MKKVAYGLSFIVIGFGIGWLVGLSISPVVSIVVSALVGVIAALSAVAGETANPQTALAQGAGSIPHKIMLAAPAAVALIVGGLVVGSIVGLTARTNNWFGLDVSAEVAAWTQLGLDRTEVAQAIFDSHYGQGGSREGQGGTAAGRPTLGVLFNVSSSTCNRLLAARPQDLQEEMSLSSNEAVRFLADSTDDPQLLREGLVELCED